MRGDKEGSRVIREGKERFKKFVTKRRSSQGKGRSATSQLSSMGKEEWRRAQSRLPLLSPGLRIARSWKNVQIAFSIFLSKSINRSFSVYFCLHFSPTINIVQDGQGGNPVPSPIGEVLLGNRTLIARWKERRRRRRKRVWHQLAANFERDETRRLGREIRKVSGKGRINILGQKMPLKLSGQNDSIG